MEIIGFSGESVVLNKNKPRVGSIGGMGNIPELPQYYEYNYDIEIDLRKNYSFFAANGIGKTNFVSYLIIKMGFNFNYIKSSVSYYDIFSTNYYGNGKNYAHGSNSKYDLNFCLLSRFVERQENLFLPSMLFKVLLNNNYSSVRRTGFNNRSFDDNQVKIYNLLNKKITPNISSAILQISQITSIYKSDVYISDILSKYQGEKFSHKFKPTEDLLGWIESSAKIFNISIISFLDYIKHDLNGCILNDFIKKTKSSMFSNKVLMFYLDVIVNFIKKDEIYESLKKIYYLKIVDVKELFEEYLITLSNFNDKCDFFQQFFPSFEDINIKYIYSPFLDLKIPNLSLKVNGDRYVDLTDFFNRASEANKKILRIFFFYIHKSFYINPNGNLLLLDDVLTSLDNSYCNNVLKFLKEILPKKTCFINLTHDFEIYRLFNNVFNLDRDFHQMLKIERNQDLVSFKDFPIKNNLYRDYLMMKPNKILNSSGTKVLNNDLSLNFIYFVSNISYYRNTVESYYSEKHPEYKLATDFLHLKNTDITIKSLLDKEFFKKTPFGKSLNPEDGEICIENKKYWDLYKDVEIDISTQFKKQGQFNGLTYDSIEIKVFYSLFCRLYMEEQMFRYLLLIEPDKFKNGVGEITSNQTNALLELFAECETQEKNGKSITFYPLRWKPEYEILSELLDCYLKVKNYISDYMHIQYNEVAYIINIKGDVLQNLVREMKEVTARADAAWNLAFSKPSTEDVKE